MRTKKNKNEITFFLNPSQSCHLERIVQKFYNENSNPHISVKQISMTYGRNSLYSGLKANIVLYIKKYTRH